MIAVFGSSTPTAVKDALQRRGYRLFPLPPHPALPSPVSTHPDLLLFFLPDAILTTESYLAVAGEALTSLSSFCSLPIRVTDRDLTARYPGDVPLNAVTVGETLICNPKCVAKEIADAYPSQIHVKQGYTKCSVVPVGAHALITQDPSIAGQAKQHGFDVLQISPEGIVLPGFPYGFPGGASCRSVNGNNGTIYFCGSLSRHPDGDAIRDFCERHGVRAESLTMEPLSDVGTIFLIE